MTRKPRPRRPPSSYSPVHDRPFLEREPLLARGSGKVCLNCAWFRHHREPNIIPLLTCELHQLDGHHGPSARMVKTPRSGLRPAGR